MAGLTTRRLVTVLGCYVCVGGFLSFLGWALDIARFADWDGHGISIQPNATLCATAAGLALVALQARRFRLATCLGALVALIGSATLFEYVAGVNLGIDTLAMFGREWGRVGVLSPGRMGPPGSISWTILGVALILAGLQRQQRMIRVLALSVVLLSSLSLIGYLYSADTLYSLPSVTVIAWQTATFNLSTGVGLIALNSDAGLGALFRRPDAAGIIVRRIAWPVIVGPILIGLLALTGHRLGFYDVEFGIALVSICSVTFLMVVLFTAARAVGRLEDSRRQAEHSLHQAQAEREALLVRERQASRLKDEFVAAVSHELRTPLNTILGWAQVLESAEDLRPDMISKATASIGRSARAQSRLVDDLVDMSRIVAGKLELRKREVDLREVAHDAVDLIRVEAHRKAQQVVVQASGESCYVYGDRDRLGQIIWNLLSNAVKFTSEGGRISVTVTSQGNIVKLVVTDSGVGISSAFLPYVFDRFRQADGSVTRTHSGLGLGLAIVKDLTELHGGSVRASSDGPGEGSSFTLQFPRMNVAEVAEVLLASSSSPPPSRAVLAGVRILAVDDNRDALDVLGTYLTGCGAIVRAADSGRAALLEWEREPAEVLICDLAMPDIDGLQVIAAITELDRAAGRLTRSIALTANASREHKAQIRAAGFNAHVAKPFEVDDLLRELVRLLGMVSPSGNSLSETRSSPLRSTRAKSSGS